MVNGKEVGATDFLSDRIVNGVKKGKTGKQIPKTCTCI